MSGGFIKGNTVAPQSSNAPAVPLQISYNDLTDLPDLSFVTTSRVEQEVTESQINIPTSSAVAGEVTELALALHGVSAQGDANTTTLENIHSQAGSTNLTAFDAALVETDTSSVIPTYNPNNTTLTDINNPTLISVSGFDDGVAIGASNLDKGKALVNDGTYFHDSVSPALTAGNVYSFKIHNPDGVSLTGHDNGLLRVRANNGTDLDTWQIAVQGEQIGITTHVPEADVIVAAHDALVPLHNGSTAYTFPITEQGATGGNGEAIYALPADWVTRGTPSLTFSITLFENGDEQQTETRDSITINNIGQNQDGFPFNITFPGEEPFVGFFYWRYRSSDLNGHEVVLEYTPDHDRSTTASFRVNLHYPIAEETKVVAEHLSFSAFAHQPVANDTLFVTLHYVSGTEWQIVATDGDGAVLENGEYDLGAYDADDIMYFIGDTTQYQRLGLDATAGADLSLEAVASLHNNSTVKGFGLFTFSDKVVFSMIDDHFINAAAVDGLNIAGAKFFRFSTERIMHDGLTLYLTDTGMQEGELIDLENYTFASLLIRLGNKAFLATKRLPKYDETALYYTRIYSSYNFNSALFTLDASDYKGFSNKFTIKSTNQNLLSLGRWIGLLFSN